MLVRLLAGALLVAMQGRAVPTEWLGTITIEERANGTFRGGDSYIGVDAVSTVTYTLNGDGTASWLASYDSKIDMGGFYTLPTTGRGAGAGYANVAFNGGGWDLHAETDDSVPTLTDHTAEDRVWETKSPLALLIEFAKASGQPVGPSGPRFEKGSAGVSGAQLPARGAAGATTLSGKITETVPGGANRLGGPGTIPSTITYSWSLHKGPVQPSVKIYGSECGCIDPDSKDATLHFIAGASPAGGEFTEFIVTSSGTPPEIVSNSGGERPSLDIRGTSDTGTVTLRIRYRHNGTTQESRPLVVEFCELEKIDVKDGDTDLAFDTSGELIVDAKTKAWRAGRDVSAEIEWEIDQVGSPTTRTDEPTNRTGDHIKFTYQHLPRQNSDFGPKQLKARTTGKCACNQAQTVRFFYIDEDSNHPDDASPNWYYYWKQTGAVPASARPMLEYRAVIVGRNIQGTSIAEYDGLREKILLSKALFTEGACRDEVDANRVRTSRPHAKGIDCFGETVRHELQHRADAIEWWGDPKGAEGAGNASALINDADGDHLPLSWEARLPGCSPISSTSCDARPFLDATDAEINAYRQGWTWQLGSVDKEDWSCGPMSKQWAGKKCG